MADPHVPKPSTLLSSLLSFTETVTLHVGPERKAFVLHRQLLMNSSEFFMAAFVEGRFKEGKEGVMYMPEDDPGAVALFAEWLYSGRIETSNTKSRLNSAYELYFLATKLMSVKLRDETMSLIQDMSYRYNWFVDLKRLAQIYEGTPEHSELRRFGIDSYHFGRLWEGAGFKKWEQPLARLLIQSQPHFTPVEMQAVWEGTKENFDLFRDILKSYRPETRVSVTNPACLPHHQDVIQIRTTAGHNYDEFGACRYHAHAVADSEIECGLRIFKLQGVGWIDDESKVW